MKLDARRGGRRGLNASLQQGLQVATVLLAARVGFRMLRAIGELVVGRAELTSAASLLRGKRPAPRGAALLTPLPLRSAPASPRPSRQGAAAACGAPESCPGTPGIGGRGGGRGGARSGVLGGTPPRTRATCASQGGGTLAALPAYATSSGSSPPTVARHAPLAHLPGEGRPAAERAGAVATDSAPAA
jgi:hypothetical protein